jgi:hypothetical protein
MLRIANIEEINGILLRVPGLVDIQQCRGPGFTEEVKVWLESLEDVLNNNRMPAAGNVAAFRGMIVSAERGVMPQGVSFYGRATLRKIKDAAAAAALRAATDLIFSTIQADISKIAEAERRGRQIIALAKAKGFSLLLPNRPDRADALKTLWRSLATDSDIGPGTVNVEGLVGPSDALIVLDRAIATDAHLLTRISVGV